MKQCEECVPPVQKASDLGAGGCCAALCRCSPPQVHVAVAAPGDTENPERSCGEAICFLMLVFCSAICNPADTRKLFESSSCISNERAHEESFLAVGILETSTEAFY